jgi:hypothetical protein
MVQSMSFGVINSISVQVVSIGSGDTGAATTNG